MRHADFNRGIARLVGGSSDPGGAWAYGRIEVSDGPFFSGVSETESNEYFGRRAAQVACRSLGFTSGAQILAESLSALPGPAGVINTVNVVACRGDEESLADCEFRDDYYDTEYRLEDGAVALVCSTPSGCSADAAEPAQGDVRLVETTGITSGTQPCDAVHFGAVEIFNAGQWGRICSGRFSGFPDFTIDANVVCRQLGFPFGSLYDLEDVRNSTGEIVGADYEDYSAPAELVWATDVLCTGKEERLDECFFPEDFGNRRASDYGPQVEAGIQRAACRRKDGNQLGVVCRKFEITESEVIRRR
eukprot:jgi/Ulvmu1/3394/UM016_0010.1